jgi:hypothetical protein
VCWEIIKVHLERHIQPFGAQQARTKIPFWAIFDRFCLEHSSRRQF